MLAAGFQMQAAGPAAGAQQQPESPEMSTRETAPGFSIKAQRNEVLVRAVVRDASGKAVGNLTKDDFRLYDNGKPQGVTVFSVEGSGARLTSVEVTEPSQQGALVAERQPAPAPAEPTAQRFVAFYFDDIVTSFEDLVRTRDAAERYLRSSLQPSDRAGIFTSSGIGDLDFTDDRDRLFGALASLRPRPFVVRPELDCPPLSPYEAYLVVEKRDQLELEIATLKFIQCACGGNPTNCPSPQERAEASARVIWNNNEMQARQSLRVLTSLVRRLALLPGQRSILWISQGFLAVTLPQEVTQLADRALRNHVVVSALDARGLYAIVPGGDATQSSAVPLSPLPGFRSSGPAVSATLVNIQSTGQSMNADVMAEVSHETGGVFFHSNNDYDAGFRLAGALPEFSYLIGFSPQNLKFDGKYHKLKVELTGGKSYSVQARRGYYAPSQPADAPERIQEEIQQAVFSQDALQELPFDFSVQFFKASDQDVKLSVVTRLDVRSLSFRKVDGRNIDELTVVVTAFDRDGNLVDGRQKVVELYLRDASVERLARSGLGTKVTLDVKPGTYMVRVVVRERESAQLSALSRAVEIPH